VGTAIHAEVWATPIPLNELINLTYFDKQRMGFYRQTRGALELQTVRPQPSALSLLSQGININ
jgi:hypothetical protein